GNGDLTDWSCKFRLILHVGERNAPFQNRRLAATGDAPACPTTRVQTGIAMPWNASFFQNEADQPALDPFTFDTLEGLTANEIALVHFDDPSQTGFEWVRFSGDVVSIEGKTRLET